LTILILATTAALFYFAILFWLFCGVRKLVTKRTPLQPFVSVIVAARNEEENIDRCLTHLQAQAYPIELFEIIVVNDRSDDQTGLRIKQFSAQHPNIKPLDISQLDPGISGKKNALASGIASAKGEIIFTTDADCVVPPGWIRETVELFDQKTGMVVGPAPFFRANSGFRKVMCVDNLWSAFISAGGLGWNVGITCTGRNLAYRKSAYDNVNGFRQIQHSISGDDDLLLHLISRQPDWEIKYNLSREAAVFSEAPASMRKFIRQRRRHVSAAKYYNRSIKLGYLVGHAANVCLCLLPFLLLNSRSFIHLIILMLVKFCADWLLLYLFAKKTGRSDEVRSMVPWQFFNLINQLVISPSGLVGKIRWR
jgi:cellulose synthase/poly-beta-1,6-N-acetylglucosamine synthase-like glycosyltransferase